MPLLLHQDRPPYELSDMPPAELKDIEDFLVAYQAADGKEAKIVGSSGQVRGGERRQEGRPALTKLEEGLRFGPLGEGVGSPLHRHATDVRRADGMAHAMDGAGLAERRRGRRT